ncbi:hypothetical protein BDV36DRAFT_247321 [Aspergillus pseudocaelatus]|uniref:Uncharacterized protein n=1 Tax=Aspergillus pseudocaelatus TaxID=1825620 RepID=A0ABQ6WX66_9EURO|nr:hypothetical protein BDV36DRAFT_247321 [Aspergillus pseudocaelatus]
MSNRSSSCSSFGYIYADNVSQRARNSMLSNNRQHTSFMVLMVSSAILNGVVCYTCRQ